ncbi:hypothetical protein LY76DRAFT_603423 [Colletotrichum caudatum]|nr:hypothetical protein LY76DRAFT_603423 [Colletotrichum caudatum]
MAPRRQAALAATASMAAVAAQEASVEVPTKAPKAQIPKSQAPKKILKVSKARGKSTATKSAGPKVSETNSPASPSIPLLCVVCPTNPHFSDVSHLLTHLNSKGHLQTFNDVRIRAITDLSAAHAISTYERWYNEHGLEAMLAERLKVKDERSKGTATGKRPGQPASQADFTKNPKKKKKLPLVVKREPRNDASWTPPPTGGLFEQQAITFYGDQNNSPVSTPTDDAIDWIPDELESARLKGIVWPGMGIFDAATPDQKKKRNQRKDASVLQQMELSSQAITTTELVANLDMEIARTRDVYDAPSVEGTPIAKSKRRQKRSRNVEEEDDEASQLIVKSEPIDKPAPQISQTTTSRQKNHTAKKELAPEMDNNDLSEKLDVTSDAASLADVDIELDEELDDSPFGTGSSLNNLNPRHCANHEEIDVFRDANRGLVARKFNEMGQSMGGDTYVFGGGGNSHVNRARMANSNNQMNQLSVADPNTTANPFNGYQQQPEIFYQQPSWGYPMVTPTLNTRFMPINGNATQPVYYTTQFAFTASENDSGNGPNVFGDEI